MSKKILPGQIVKATRAFVAWDLESEHPRLVAKGDILIVAGLKTHHRANGNFMEAHVVIQAEGSGHKCRLIDYPDVVFKILTIPEDK